MCYHSQAIRISNKINICRGKALEKHDGYPRREGWK